MQIYQGTVGKDWSRQEFVKTLSNLKSLQQVSTQQKKTSAKLSNEEVASDELLQTAITLVQSAKGKDQRQCVFCSKANHFSDQCKTVSDVKKRREVVRTSGRCFNCLATNHRAKECSRNKKCFYCKGIGHHCSLCTKLSPKQGESTVVAVQQIVENETNSSSETHLQVHLAGAGEDDGIIMATARVPVSNPHTGTEKELMIYVDSGARYTCINKKKADDLGLTAVKSVVLDTARFNTGRLKKVEADVVTLKIEGVNGFCLMVNAYAIPDMTPPLPVYPVSLGHTTLEKVRRYKPLNLPPSRAVQMELDILIGMDYWYSIMGPKVCKTVPVQGALAIHQTPLGNILAGNTLLAKGVHPSFQTEEVPTAEEVSNLWKLETIGIGEENDEAFPQEQVLQRFKETTVRENGRYFVQRPWKDPNPQIPTNFHVARHRLQQTLNTLAPTEEAGSTLPEYNAIIQDQLTKGIIEPVNTQDDDKGRLIHYISHFPHIRRDRATTTVRIVYDASAKTKPNKLSLNDLIFKGVNYLGDLAGLLIRFCLPKIVLIFDIEKAFLQVGLQQAERNSTRCLWLKDPVRPQLENNIQIYRFTRILFGVVASPFLLGATIDHHLSLHPGKLSDGIRGNVYMDNIFQGADSSEEALTVYNESKALFNDDAMNLREWMSNDAEVMKLIPAVDRMKEATSKVLGVPWSSVDDTIQVSAKLSDLQECTKRVALHQTSKGFDPLGLVSPITIRGRIKLQQLWKEGLKWDDPLPEGHKKEWIQILECFKGIPGIKLQRRLLLSSESPVELLCFTDASVQAYAAAVYVRQSCRKGTKSGLFFAKARVVPTKPSMTIPRLELLGVLIGLRALKFVEKEIRHPVRLKQLWTDSQIVLHWIKSEKKVDPYVQRRLSEITQDPSLKFEYVRSSENPADIASRGSTLKTMLESNWFTGPDWLNKDQEIWPSWEMPANEKTVESVNVALPVAPLATTHKMERSDLSAGPFEIRIDRFSSLLKLLKVTGYCARFVDSIRHKPVPNTKILSAEELRQALALWIQACQAEKFQEDIQAIRKDRQTQLSKQLDLFLENGILRCGGRLANAPISEEAKFPALLPKGHVLTNLIIKDAHDRILHYGARLTLSEVRQRFWIPQGLRSVKKVIESCLTCRRLEGKSFRPPKMAALPAERLERCRAFKYTGLDYLGPVMVNVSGQSQKRWMALFTCFVTRAVHLEVIKDCTAESALNAVQRFVSRRGTPFTVLSDNASQFGKASAMISEIWNKKVAETVVKDLRQYFAKNGINWKFIPERSPWVGGFYERIVGMVKRALKKSLWRVSADEDTLQTLVTSIEGILNSRPLLMASTELKDEQVLTPANFIAPSVDLSLPPTEEDPQDPDFLLPRDKIGRDLRRSWKKAEKRLDQFWKIWRTQYLQELKEAHKVHFKRKRGEIPRSPKPGEVVLLQEDCPRVTWKLARIKRLLAGPDGEVRFAEVRLPSGRLTRRGVKDMVPLELDFHYEPDNIDKSST